MVSRKPLDWRSCEFVSLSNAARIAGRAPGWAQELVTTGELECKRLPCGGPPVVTVRSLANFLERAQPAVRLTQKQAGRPALRLVTNNS